MDAVAELRNVDKTYFKPGTEVLVRALRGVTIQFERGMYTAIMGASGSGKSTMLNILGCLDRPTSGHYVVDGVDVGLMTDDLLSELRCSRIGFVFQNFNLIAQLTVQENLEAPMFYARVPRPERRRRAAALAERVGLGDRLHHRPVELSGGQQQRVCIARSLANDPLILLADEPTGALDSKTGQSILNLFDELVSDGRTVLMVTHDPNVAARCRRVIRLHDGEVSSDMMN